MEERFTERTPAANVGRLFDASRIDLASRIGVRAIGAGVLVTLSGQLLLMALGGALGLHTGIVRTEHAGAGFLAWLLLALVVASYVGAWVAAMAARSLDRRDGVLNGFVTWSASTLASLFLVGGALRSLVGGALAFTVPSSASFALGAWATFAAFLLPACAAILGGLQGTRSEASVVTRVAMTSTRPTVGSPTPPMPQAT